MSDTPKQAEVSFADLQEREPTWPAQFRLPDDLTQALKRLRPGMTLRYMPLQEDGSAYQGETPSPRFLGSYTPGSNRYGEYRVMAVGEEDGEPYVEVYEEVSHVDTPLVRLDLDQKLSNFVCWRQDVFKTYTIALTGGPGSGKSTLIPYLTEMIQDMGFHAVVVPETVTALVESGYPLGDMLSTHVGLIDFERSLLRMQATLEQQTMRMPFPGPTVILLDRSIPDILSYVAPQFWKNIFRYEQSDYCPMLCSDEDWREGYDLILHLDTAARASGYTTANNVARRETEAEAITVCDQVWDGWTRCMLEWPDAFTWATRHRIQASESFDEKCGETLQIVANSLEGCEDMQRNLRKYQDWSARMKERDS